MKVFLGLMVCSFLAGVLPRQGGERPRVAILLGVCGLVCCAYYFLNQI